MAERFEVSRVIAATARRLYEAWLDPTQHALMTGAATSGGENGAYTAWDGYISGRTVSAEPFARIVQTWRTTEFPEGHPDSELTIEFTEVEGGTELKLTHDEVPDGQGDSYLKGWHEHYFDPMQRHFSSPRERLKELGAAMEQLAESATQAVDNAVEQATEAFDDAADNVNDALVRATKQARAKAKKAVKSGKAMKKKVTARAKSLGKQVRALVKSKTKKLKPKPKKSKVPAKKARKTPKKKPRR